MAEVILDNQRVLVKPWWDKSKVVLTWAGLGLLWYIISLFLSNFVVTPLACRNLDQADMCVNSVTVSGNIALVIVAVVALLALVHHYQPRPIIIVTATTITLWGLAGLSEGMAWPPALFGTLALFVISYGLFTIIASLRSVLVAVILACVIAFGIQLLLTL